MKRSISNTIGEETPPKTPPDDADDGGKWGKHIWPLVLDVPRERGFKGLFAKKFVNKISQ